MPKTTTAAASQGDEKSKRSKAKAKAESRIDENVARSLAPKHQVKGGRLKGTG